MATISPKSGKNPPSQWLQGLGLVLLATLALSLQNVIARIATSTRPISILGGLFELGGYVSPNADKLQVSLLVLLLRVTCVVPMLWVMVSVLKPGAWGEVKQIVMGGDRTLKLKIVSAGLLLFLSQIGTYLAIKDVGPAIAVTVFFIYPTITTLLAWKLFGDRPSWQQWVAIGLIYAGCTWLTFAPHPQPPKPAAIISPASPAATIPSSPKTPSPAMATASPGTPTAKPSVPASPGATPTPKASVSPGATPSLNPSISPTAKASVLGSPVTPAPPKPIASSGGVMAAASPTPATPAPAPSNNSFILGVIEATLAGIVFAMEGILAQSCFSQVNPAIFTGMIFSVEWVALLAVTLPFNKIDINQGLVLMGGLLSLATLSGYLFNNFGIKLIGAASVAVIGSSGPAVTSILALVILSDVLTMENWLAILVVTIGVVLMNLAKAAKKRQQEANEAK